MQLIKVEAEGVKSQTADIVRSYESFSRQNLLLLLSRLLGAPPTPERDLRPRRFIRFEGGFRSQTLITSPNKATFVKHVRKKNPSRQVSAAFFERLIRKISFAALVRAPDQDGESGAVK